MRGPGPLELRRWFGEIDIYLFDQLLKGRITPGMQVLDAGCGTGRNLVYLLRSGVRVFAVDESADALAHVRCLAADLAPSLPATNFQVVRVEDLPFDDESFDAVISSAVLHFADDERHFDAMLDQMWRVLRCGGFLFARLASSIGLESRIERIAGRRYHLPDGTERFLVDESFLEATRVRLGGDLLEPVKTVNVQNERCMTTWCVGKP